MAKNKKISIIIMAIGAAACLGIRLFTIISCTDMKTGFLYPEKELLCNILFYGTAAAAALVSALTSGKKAEGYDLSQKSVIALGAGMLVMGFCAGWEGFMEMSAFTPSTYLIIIDLAFAVYMLVVGYMTLYKKEMTAGIGFAFTLVGFYFVLRGIFVLIDRMVITAVPEYMIEALSLVFGAVFFAFLGKILSNSAGKLTKGALCFFGAASAALTLSPSLATIISKIAAPAEISARIAFTPSAAEQFNQLSAGVDGYMLSFTPYVNMAMGAFAIMAVVISLASADD